MTCVVFVGLPGSGKTTFYRTHFAGTHELISKDAFPNAKDRERRQRELLQQALRAGRSVVIDNTNPRVEDRAPIIALARSYGAEVIGYFFDVSTRESVARNEARQGASKVPRVAIFTVAKRLRAPTYQEGFDRLFRVRPLGRADASTSKYEFEVDELQGRA